ncbi:hypothetical protein [Pseudoalteromonas byunsanensis]|uniref:Uncharacterized protein n=1 Tax=Pseudoalteromonas byunsanensis TaxID=327939 RepID=A0A1S1NDW7_9GAMM|nr:hypothetical protein [Pseudoalteromonas byunsanensis]OHU97901.1 hypothetical protein BIW53_00565 [Pseudoalteromonas byunsanensis]
MRAILYGALVCFSVGASAQRYYSELFSEQDLGKSFAVQTHKVGDKCLTGTVVHTPVSSGELDYLQRQNETQIRRRTFGELHGGVNLFIIAGSVSTSMTHRNATDTLSLTSQLHLKLEQGYSALEERQVVAGYEDLSCGNDFVYQVRYGRDLFLNARLHFRTEEDYKKFVTKIKIRVLFFKKTKTKIKEIEKFAANAVLSIDANSNGALPAGLEQLMANNPKHCRGNNITPCLDTLQKLADYTFGGPLSSELNNLPKITRSIMIESYQDSGHYELSSLQGMQSSEQYSDVWLAIDERYGKAVRDVQRAEAFLAVATEDEQPDAQAQFDAAKVNLEEMEVLRSSCFADPNQPQCR